MIWRAAWALVACAGTIAALAGTAGAGGFAVPEVGARRTGMAAVVGRPDEPTAVYHNPAGLTLLEGTHLYVSLGASFPTTDMRLHPWPGSNQYINEPLDAEGYYPRTQPTRAFGIIPMIVATTNVFTRDLTAAISFYVPNATGAAFGEDGVVRYHLVDSLLVAGYGGLSLGWKPLRWLAVGAGVSMIYVTISARRKIFPVLNGMDLSKLLGKNTDLTLAGSDVTWGWNFGVLLRPIERLTIGATVISRSDATLKGDVTIHPGDDSFFRDFNGTQSTALLIPWTFMAGANLDVHPNLEIGAEVRYWLYSQLKTQHTDVMGISLLTALDSPKNYSDSWQLSGGVRLHTVQPGLEAMLGLHYDSSPAPDSTVSLDQPSFNHVGLHSGLRWSFKEHYRVGLTWAHYWYLERRTWGSITQPPSNFAASGTNDIVTASLEVALDGALLLKKKSR